MTNRAIGYEFLAAKLKTAVFPLDRPARVAPVTRITQQPGAILVPSSVAPTSDAPIEHLFFALKHEGLNMAAAVAALRRMSAAEVALPFLHATSSRYARIACYLWEIAHEETLPGLPAATGMYEKLFDDDTHLTDAAQRSTRWRIDFNGIGTPYSCITVRRTHALRDLLAQDVMGQAADFVSRIDQAMLDRAVRWAYLGETDNSYAIERERPTASKAEAFASLLARAHDDEPVTEDYLVALQNLTVSNPLDKAVAFREQQNRLRNDLRGALGVTYLPPPPEMIDAVMDSVMHLINRRDSVLDPVVRGTLASFAFVFAHPFMDGNGRLSRFLFHKVACTDKRLRRGLVLPVSIAMKRNEGSYLAALQSFSKPSRALWDVRSASDEDIDQDFRGDPEIYRYWDGTACLEFGLAMAAESLQRDLQEELAFLRRYDAIYAAVNEAVDMNNHDLVVTVRAIAETRRLSNNRRRQLIAKGHSEALLETVVTVAIEALHALEADED